MKGGKKKEGRKRAPKKNRPSEKKKGRMKGAEKKRPSEKKGLEKN